MNRSERRQGHTSGPPKSIELSELVIYEAVDAWLRNEGKLPWGAKVGKITLNPDSRLAGGSDPDEVGRAYFDYDADADADAE